MNKTKTQFVRYVVVGLISNLVLYLAYISITSFGIGHKLAMSLLYVVGVAQTFIFNRSWSFEHQGAMRGAFTRYVISYAVGYLLNLSVLWLAVDHFDFPHQIVQGVMIVIIAILMFFIQKYWVFPLFTAQS